MKWFNIRPYKIRTSAIFKANKIRLINNAMLQYYNIYLNFAVSGSSSSNSLIGDLGTLVLNCSGKKYIYIRIMVNIYFIE